jgi:hypothetical protein
VSLSAAVTLAAFKFSFMDIVGWLATLQTFGLIYAYLATSISAAKMLQSLNVFSMLKMLVVGASIVVLAFALIGSLYPTPPFPYNILPFIFCGYMLLGWFWCRKPKVVTEQANESGVDFEDGVKDLGRNCTERMTFW